MRLGKLALFSSIVVSLAFPAAAATTRARRGSGSPKATRHIAKSRIVGQRTIDDERATQIQAALIKAGYLSGSPSGHWDAESIAAMTKVQADNGWQTKLVPDSRALIKIGLGPASASSPGTETSPATNPGQSLASPPSRPGMLAQTHP